MRPLLSICLPTFQRADELSQFLASLQGEELGEIEIVISDNASRDATAEVIDGFKKQGMPIVNLTQAENMGFGKNLANTVRHAAGEYLWFMGDDDLLEKGAIAGIKAVLLDHRPEVVLVNGTIWNHDFTRQLSASMFRPRPASGFYPFPEHPVFNLSIMTFLGNILLRNTGNIGEIIEKYVGNAYPHTFALLSKPAGNSWYLHAVPSVRQRFPLGVTSEQERIFFIDLPAVYDYAENLAVPAETIARWKRKFLKEMLTRRCLSIKIQQKKISGRILRSLAKDYGRFAHTWLVAIPLYLLPHSLLRKAKDLFSYNK